MRTALASLLALTLCTSAFPASADDVADAQAKFKAGATAYREARYKDAIDLFMAANRLDPHPELVFNVGQAFEKLGDVPNALRSYRDYLRKAPDAPDRGTVETSIRNLELRLRDKGLQQVSIFSNPSGAIVVLDSKEVGTTPWTGEMGPGRHVAVLRATGFPDNAKEFLLTGDRAMDLDISLSKTPGSGATVVGSVTAVAPASGAPTASIAPIGSGAPTAKGAGEAPATIGPGTWVALAAGVVSFGAALGLEAARKGAEEAARSEPTQTGYKEKYDAMVTDQTASRVLAGVGAAAIVVGGVLLVLDLRKMGAPAAAPQKGALSSPAMARVGLGCSGVGCWLSATGRF